MGNQAKVGKTNQHAIVGASQPDPIRVRARMAGRKHRSHILPTPEKAREQAKAAEREIMAGNNYRGPLHGITFGLKDIYATSGIRTTSYSKICENLFLARDATTVAKLYEVGAVFATGGVRC